MEDWTEIRRRVLVEGVSRRQILRETGMPRQTLKKILEHSEPPGYRQQQPRPRKQRHTAKRIWERLREAGFTGGYTVVKDAVRELTQKHQEVFVPLLHRPGEAQVDFGHALANVNGRLRKVAFFVMTLPYSDATFVMAFERECTETFWEGHVQAFEFFQGVPTRITYDNTKVAVSQIIGKERRLTQGFLQLKSHYLFAHHFCRVARGNEKGVVEGQVKFTRLNYFVPVPQVRDLAELNARLQQRCQEDQARWLRGQPGPKAELLLADRQAFLPLPTTPFEACRKFSTTASSLSLVRFDRNDYSVPVRYAHHPIVAKGYFDRVVLCADGREVARHARIWEDEQVCFEPLHYLALLETKPGALDHARPLAGWTLPECFALLRRRLEAERDGDGTREYIKVLRLLEQASAAEVAGGGGSRLASGGHHPRRGRPVPLSPGRLADHALLPGRSSAPAARPRSRAESGFLHGFGGRCGMSKNPAVLLLEHHLKELKLPTFLRDYDSVGAVCSQERCDDPTYLLRLAERELIDRERRATERRIKEAAFPVLKTIETFDFAAQVSINEPLVRELLRGEYISKRENLLLVGNPGTGKTHLASALGFAACTQGKRVRFTTTTGLVTQLLEQRETRTLQRLHKQLERLDVLLLDELGYVPFSKSGAELLFDVVSRAYERTSLIVTTNLPFEQWTEVLGSERLTGALLDRLTHRVHILEANGQSYRLTDAKRRLKRK